MNVKTETKYKLAAYIERLPAEQVKQAIIQSFNEDMDWETCLMQEVDVFKEWVKNQRKKSYYTRCLQSRSKVKSSC